VRMVVSELRGEKIDIIPYNEEPARFVAKALSPARVREVLVDDENQQATVIVPDDQLSLAIGRDGQNARLAAKLTGWKVDIKSEQEFAEMEEELEIEEEGAEVADGRCAAVLSAGRRCPNASLQGSRYCGLPQHQALARFPTNQVTVLAPLSEEEIAKLADPEANEDEVRPLVDRATSAFEEDGAEAPPAEPAAEPESEVPAAAEASAAESEDEQPEAEAAEPTPEPEAAEPAGEDKAPKAREAEESAAEEAPAEPVNVGESSEGGQEGNPA
jgi:transcription termination/antitermination protein NusA